jgi:hypothetical protein
VLAPSVMIQSGRLGANFIIIPPIRANNLPFTIGLQLEYRLK